MPSSSSSQPCIKSRKPQPQIQVAMIFVKQKKAWSSLVPRWMLASPYLLPSWEFRCVSFFYVVMLSYWLLSQTLKKMTAIILRALFIRKRGESLRQVERFFLCVRAIMSIHLRWPDHQYIEYMNIFINSIRAFLGQTVILNIGQWQLRHWRTLWSTWGLTWWVGWKPWSLDHITSGSFTVEDFTLRYLIV